MSNPPRACRLLALLSRDSLRKSLAGASPGAEFSRARRHGCVAPARRSILLDGTARHAPRGTAGARLAVPTAPDPDPASERAADPDRASGGQAGPGRTENP